MTRRTLVAIASLLLCACPPNSGTGGGGEPSSKPTAPASAACSAFGQSCVFAPGKLGVCVERTGGCQGSDCFTCQSLH